MKQLFPYTGQQSAKGCDPWENGKKLNKHYSDLGCTCGSTFHSAVLGEDKAYRVPQYCGAGKREMEDQGEWGSFNLWSTALEKSNPHRKTVLEIYKRVSTWDNAD